MVSRYLILKWMLFLYSFLSNGGICGAGAHIFISNKVITIIMKVSKSNFLSSAIVEFFWGYFLSQSAIKTDLYQY